MNNQYEDFQRRYNEAMRKIADNYASVLAQKKAEVPDPPEIITLEN